MVPLGAEAVVEAAEDREVAAEEDGVVPSVEVVLWRAEVDQETRLEEGAVDQWWEDEGDHEEGLWVVQAVPPEAIIREDSGAVRPEATDSVAAAEGEAVDSAGDAEVATGLEGTGEAEEAPEAADPEAEVVQVDGEAVAASVAPAVAGEWAEDRDKKRAPGQFGGGQGGGPGGPKRPRFDNNGGQNGYNAQQGGYQQAPYSQQYGQSQAYGAQGGYGGAYGAQPSQYDSSSYSTYPQGGAGGYGGQDYSGYGTGQGDAGYSSGYTSGPVGGYNSQQGYDDRSGGYAAGGFGMNDY